MFSIQLIKAFIDHNEPSNYSLSTFYILNSKFPEHHSFFSDSKTAEFRQEKGNIDVDSYHFFIFYSFWGRILLQIPQSRWYISLISLFFLSPCWLIEYWCFLLIFAMFWAIMAGDFTLLSKGKVKREEIEDKVWKIVGRSIYWILLCMWFIWNFGSNYSYHFGWLCRLFG